MGTDANHCAFATRMRRQNHLGAPKWHTVAFLAQALPNEVEAEIDQHAEGTSKDKDQGLCRATLGALRFAAFVERKTRGAWTCQSSATTAPLRCTFTFDREAIASVVLAKVDIRRLILDP